MDSTKYIYKVLNLAVLGIYYQQHVELSIASSLGPTKCGYCYYCDSARRSVFAK
jgi:hypothetical protein